jgi:hypothetical protein
MRAPSTSLPVRGFDKEHQFGMHIKLIVTGLYVAKA